MPPGLCGLDVALPWLEMEKKKKKRFAQNRMWKSCGNCMGWRGFAGEDVFA